MMIMNRLWLLIFVLLFAGCGGEGGSSESTVCVVNLDEDCRSDATLDDEVETAGLNCEAQTGDICGDAFTIDAVISTDGDLGDLLSKGRRVPYNSDYREILED
jgi:hypothetical protein